MVSMEVKTGIRIAVVNMEDMRMEVQAKDACGERLIIPLILLFIIICTGLRKIIRIW